MTYTPDPFDTTTNDGILVPSIVWMQLVCKRPKTTDITRRREEVVVHLPRVPYSTTYEPDRWVFQPLTQPSPPWQIAQGFIVGTYIVEAHATDLTPNSGPMVGESLLMWDLANQEQFRPGDIIHASPLQAARHLHPSKP